MRDDLTTNLHISAHLGGVAPRRHDLARQQYVKTLAARHEGEQRAAMIGGATKAIAQLWALANLLGLLRTAFAPAHSIGTPAARRGNLPAE